MQIAFTLKYRLPACADHDELVERLYAAGCGDAVVGLGEPGHMGLYFAREAESVEAASIAAMASIARAVPEAQLLGIGGLLDL